MFRKLYDWVLHWANTPYGPWALFILSFIESSFFPVPPDVLLIALAVALPRRAFFYALVCSIGSVMGGCLGYFIGAQFMNAVGMPIIELYGLMEQFDHIRTMYAEYGAWAIAIAGFTPIPYKVFTISAGAFNIDFFVFFMASSLSRSARFFMVGGLIYLFGPQIQHYITKYFDKLAIAFVVLLIGGFIVIKYLL